MGPGQGELDEPVPRIIFGSPGNMIARRADAQVAGVQVAATGGGCARAATADPIGHMEPLDSQLRFLLEADPVSYTHLDVYKRQHQARPGPGPYPARASLPPPDVTLGILDP